MIEDVESLRPELQLEPFMDRKIPPDSQVHLPCPEFANKVPWSIAYRTGKFVCKGIGVDCPAARTSLPWLKISQPLEYSVAIGAVQIDWFVWNKIYSRTVNLSCYRVDLR